MYPNSKDSIDVQVVVYGNLQDEQLHKWHAYLKEKADKNELVYALRHFVKVKKWEGNLKLLSFVKFLQDPIARKVRLSGYGVELAIKSTEYKAQDDSKIRGSTSW